MSRLEFIPPWMKGKEAQWMGMRNSEAALHIASSQKHQREIGENWGPFVKALLAIAGVFHPAPWCAAFVTACLVRAGVDRGKLPKLAASTYYWLAWAKETDRLVSVPKREDVVAWNNRGKGHIFFVSNVKPLPNGDYLLYTIEGNTNTDGSREGVEVAPRERKLSDIKKNQKWGIIRLTDL